MYHYAIVHSGQSIHDALQKRGHNEFKHYHSMWASLLIDLENERGFGIWVGNVPNSILNLLNEQPNAPHAVATHVYNPTINNNWVSPIHTTIVFVWRSEE